MHEYRPSHIDAKNAVAFAAMEMKAHYNSRHQAWFFSTGDVGKNSLRIAHETCDTALSRVQIR